MSIVGILWYFLILLFSGFGKNKVYIVLENDGYIFEEGAGAAHIRRQRWRGAKRWAVVGLLIGFVSAILFLLLILATALVVDQYKAEIEQAYPELTFFESTNQTNLDQAKVDEARLVVLIIIILFNLSVLGIFTGYMLAIISYVQAAAYRVEVAPLPGFR
jgi:hypothetical protein